MVVDFGGKKGKTTGNPHVPFILNVIFEMSCVACFPFFLNEALSHDRRVHLHNSFEKLSAENINRCM